MIRVFHTHHLCSKLGVFTRLAAEHLNLQPAKLLINAVNPASLTNGSSKHHPTHLEILIDQTANHYQHALSITRGLIRIKQSTSPQKSHSCPIDLATQQQTLLTAVTQKMDPWASTIYTP